LGFEPDSDECKRLNDLPNEAHGLLQMQILPVALASEHGMVTINVCKNHYASSLLLPNPVPTEPLIITGVNTVEDLEVVDTFQCEATTLDRVVADQGLTNVDFVKLDTQGSELDIIEGGASTFRAKVLLANIEVEFIEMYKDQPLFGDVDRRMQELGFVLLDLNPLLEGKPKGSIVAGRGQLIFSEALYMRDVLASESEFLEKASLATRVRLILMLEAEGFLSHAVEIAHRSVALDTELFESLAEVIPRRNRDHHRNYFRHGLTTRLSAGAMKLYGGIPSPLKTIYRKSPVKQLRTRWIKRRILERTDERPPGSQRY
jgi:FkbM family methyltransferase